MGTTGRNVARGISRGASCPVKLIALWQKEPIGSAEGQRQNGGHYNDDQHPDRVWVSPLLASAIGISMVYRAHAPQLRNLNATK